MFQGDDGELVQFVPGNLGRDDEGSEGDVLESECKRGPSARKIEERWRESLQWANHTHILIRCTCARRSLRNVATLILA